MGLQPVKKKPSFSKTRAIMQKRREKARKKRQVEQVKLKKPRERKLGPRDIGRKSKRSFQEPDYDLPEFPDACKPRPSFRRKNDEHTRRVPRAKGPREIGRKSKQSFEEPKYNMRKVSEGIYTERLPKARPPKRAPRKLGPRDIGRKSK